MGWLASLQSGTYAKRASYAQIIMNIGGVLLFLPFVIPYTNLISTTSKELARQIANAHTVFNVIVSILMLPLVKPLAKFVEKIIPEKEEEEAGSGHGGRRGTDPRQLKMPAIALQLSKEEVLRVGWITHEMLEKASEGMLSQKSDSVKWVLKREEDVDSISWNLENFLESIPGDKLNPDDQKTLENLKHFVTDIERVGDHANNLAEFARKIDKKKIKITKYGRKELRTLFKRVLHNYGGALKAIKSGNKKHSQSFHMNSKAY